MIILLRCIPFTQRAGGSRNFGGDLIAETLDALIVRHQIPSFLVFAHRDRSFFFNDTAPTEIYPLSPHDALPISIQLVLESQQLRADDLELVSDQTRLIVWG